MRWQGLLAIVGLLPALWAQRDPSGTNIGLASIQGRVLRQEAPDQVLEQLPVQLNQSNGTPITTAYTSGNGQFLFNNLPTGGYEISVSLAGYQRYSEKVNVQTASGRLYVQVYLRRLEEPAPAGPASPSVSAREMLAPAAALREREKGLENLRRGNLAAAERHLKKAVAVYPGYSRAWVELGDLQARASRPQEALHSFHEALRHDGQNREALLAVARLLNDQGRHLEALRAAAQFEQMDARDARNHLEIARGLLGAGKTREAEQAARQLESEPHAQAPEVHLVLFSILQSRQDKAQAATELRTYLKEMADAGIPAATPAIARARNLLAKLETELAATR